MIQSIYHFSPGKNWMNDPNGPIFVKGNLHLFYQKNPFGATWGNMTWGHTVSSDMVHWSHLPDALHPDQTYDKGGVFSGCSLMHNGIPHIFYTGVYPECLCMALGSEDADSYEKVAGNPILIQPEHGLIGWRDPFIWKQVDGWHMVLGAAKPQSVTFIDHYISDDLEHWRRLPILLDNVQQPADSMWECPNVILDDKGNMAVLISALPDFVTKAIIGTYIEGVFQTLSIRRYDLGDCFYAPNTVTHPDGRQIQFGWLREKGDEEARAAQGWQGLISLPREVRLQDGDIFVRPAKEVDTLRGLAELILKNELLAEGSALHLGKGSFWDFSICFRGNPEVTIHIGDGASVSFTKDGEFKVQVDGYAGVEYRLMCHKILLESSLRIRLFLDGTALEIYINDHYSASTRIYPQGPIETVFLVAGSATDIEQVGFYPMQSAFS